MRRSYPTRKCDGCKRLLNGQFSRTCRRCANRYTAEYVSRGVYMYRGEAMTVREWSEIAGCSVRALYKNLERTRNIEEAFERMGRLHIVNAVIVNRTKEK